MNKLSSFAIGLCALAFVFLLASGAILNAASAPQESAKGTAVQDHKQPIDEDTMRFEGEKRYSANCGRCHQPPHKLSPRVMATAIRHMRVRATLTDEDMRYILWYMTR